MSFEEQRKFRELVAKVAELETRIAAAEANISGAGVLIENEPVGNARRERALENRRAGMAKARATATANRAARAALGNEAAKVDAPA